MLDDVDCLQSSEAIVLKRVRKSVELHENVRPGAGIAVDADGSGQLIDSTADVKNVPIHKQRTIVQRTRPNKLDNDTLRLLYTFALMC